MESTKDRETLKGVIFYIPKDHTYINSHTLNEFNYKNTIGDHNEINLLSKKIDLLEKETALNEDLQFMKENLPEKKEKTLDIPAGIENGMSMKMR